MRSFCLAVALNSSIPLRADSVIPSSDLLVCVIISSVLLCTASARPLTYFWERRTNDLDILPFVKMKTDRSIEVTNLRIDFRNNPF